MTKPTTKTTPSSTTAVGKRGTIVIPAGIRRRYGLEEGALLIAEEREDGILLRPAVALPLERYSPARRAEFLLSNAVGAEDYQRAMAAVRALGLDPKNIPHRKPGRK
ncbi:MAG: AbrB/MazE/SpoVT family DNA-binding domain-containing protein [Gemmatimonadetes bacterium]|nr:AbrB/MazE/SpoVT family DNA-binding domain-containing protein [Gemmatimonadota bacterium]